MLPALSIDGKILTESDNILISLENEFGTVGKGMKDALVTPLRKMERTLFQAWCQWLCNPARSEREETSNEESFSRVANIVNLELGKTSGPYFLGEELSTADIIFTPYIERMAASLF